MSSKFSTQISTTYFSTPFFKKGSLLSITLILNNQIEQNLTGICLKKKHKGLNTSFVLKHVVNNESILQALPLYSPFIKKIKVLNL